MNKSIKFQVSGKVQGVFFRLSTKNQADSLGVGGWVHNRDDGNVAGVATGTADQLDSFSLWLAHGPRMARVDNLVVEDCDLQNFSGFAVR